RLHTRFSRDWSSDVCSSYLCFGFLAYGFIGLGKFVEIFIPWSSVEPYLPFSIAPPYVAHFYGVVFCLLTMFYSILGGMTSIVIEIGRASCRESAYITLSVE